MNFYVFLLGAALVSAQTAPPSDPVVLTIGDEKVTKSQFEQIVNSLPDAERAKAQTPAGKRKIAEQLHELKALANEARQRKLDQTPVTQTRIMLSTEQLLANTAYQDMANAKPDEATLRAYYTAHTPDWEQLKVRHILIHFKGSRGAVRPNQKELTEEEALAKAKELREKIVGGGDFAKLAETESDDTGTATRGGDLGPTSRGRGLAPDFEKAAFSQEVGKVTEPVKTVFGYHLILVDARETKPFEAVRPEIEQKIKPDMAKKGLADVLQKTPAVLDEAYFGK
jgi:peptidyl-prolyl cis-trans isomerase C